MGTHPIFESDFDSNRESVRNGRRKTTNEPTVFSWIGYLILGINLHKCYALGVRLFSNDGRNPDWFYNSHNKGRQLSDILPQILKAEAAAATAEDDDEEEEDDEE